MRCHCSIESTNARGSSIKILVSSATMGWNYWCRSHRGNALDQPARCVGGAPCTTILSSVDGFSSCLSGASLCFSYTRCVESNALDVV